ncbi:MAG: hypothetical protein RLZZ398_199 [Verrucomicrobiota bacterium]|jgi:hypothetical protein
MTKLYWIVCDDRNSTIYEGRYQGRTRAAAIKFLKATLGRSSLKNLVFTITEIPVPLIREIVIEVLETLQRDVKNRDSLLNGRPTFDSQSHQSTAAGDDVLVKGTPAPARKSERKVGNPGLGDDFWKEVQACWIDCRSIKQTAIKFQLSQNSVKTRARREGWRKSCPPT